ncbi:hydroxymethylglutaryl-CoA lyase [Noviherbaspirillum humi]|uniref:Hydroxymethylglutaryl-CoA lyase n=1 Tax=Noviherbaspirillum humi TaxID=1688639 RepID=A0A239HS48_9BURK|nr:hydroxymethylglutaryl-CoA lyase [Noviherbaspirillum humi]SNS84139.1 hydroxymethylglutaryl-CoA lyase [Noviherbaspirillum humi]
MSDRIEINEVSPRDGLQMEKAFVPTENKIAYIDALSECGFACIEVTSYTSPKAIPTLADADAVMAGIRRVPGVRYTALVPNLRGMERAVAGRPDEINLVMSVSETHNRANLRMTREQSVAGLQEVLREADKIGLPCNVSLSTAFGCPFDGEIDPAEVLRLAKALADSGAAGITACDTTGMAHPAQVKQVSEMLQKDLAIPVTIHLHNTRGMGLANALAAYETGIRRFDAASGGLGGCPYAPGASGNVSTEELAHMFASMGVDTGVDVEKLLGVVRTLSGLVGRNVTSQLAEAGTRLRRYAPPAWLAEKFPQA